MSDLKELTDERLMKAYQDGNEMAFEILYQRHSTKVYGFLQTRLRDRAFSDDVFQAAFMKLHQTRSSYDPSFPFIPWLFTVCRSAMIDGLRKKERILEESDPEAVEGAIAIETSPTPPLPDLTVLPVAQRQAVEFRYTHDLSFEEIAERMEISPLNARQLVSRAVRQLKKVMNGEWVKK